MIFCAFGNKIIPKNSIFFAGRPLLGEGRVGQVETGDGRDILGERRGIVERRGDRWGIVGRLGDSIGMVGRRGESREEKGLVGEGRVVGLGTDSNCFLDTVKFSGVACSPNPLCSRNWKIF